MRDDSTTQGVLFNGLFDKLLSARFDQPDSSSDGGAILLKACDKKLGLIEAIASCLRDRRDRERVVHGVRELVQQRVYGMACGYEDCNDSARLSADPVHRLLLDRDPIDGDSLASQPTLSRFENRIAHWSVWGTQLRTASSHVTANDCGVGYVGSPLIWVRRTIRPMAPGGIRCRCY